MVFLASISILLWLTLTLCVKAVMRANADKDSTSASRTIATLMVPTMLLSTPVMIELLQVSRAVNGLGVSMGYDYLPMSMLGVGSTALLIVFGFRLYAQCKNQEPGFNSVGATVIGLVISGYLSFVSLDQFLFYVPHRESAGVLNWTYFKDQVPDVKCDSEMLLVRDIDAKVATYRCPAPVQLVLGRFSGAPLVAWPSYSEGRSEQLASAIRKMNEEAIKVENHSAQ